MSNFSQVYFNKHLDDVDIDDIQSLIEEKVKEGTTIDYKMEKASYSIIAKVISSFLNTKGGLLVYGVKEKDEIPIEITGCNKTVIQLQRSIYDRVTPWHDNIKFRKIENSDEPVKNIILIEVPKSQNPPHMTDNRYYYRNYEESTPMTHYQIKSIFNETYLMKDKLIEEIHIPLSTVLDKQIKALEKYDCPSSQDIDAILSKTYYRRLMTWETYENLDYYNNQIKDLHKLEYFALKELRVIINTILVKLLEIKPITVPIDELNFHIKAIYNNSGFDLYPNLLFERLLTEKKIKDFLIKEYYQHVFTKILIEFSNKNNYIDIDDFEKNIWEKCIKESLENQTIIQMKEKAKEIKDLAWDLLDEITSY